jgi:hypothetical protein
MTSADLPVQKALFARLSTMTLPWTTNPTPTEPLPYGILGMSTETDTALRTKTTSGSELTHTVRIYSTSQTQAKQLAATTIALVMATPLTLEGNLAQVGSTRLDISQIINDRTPQGDIYSAVIRFRFKVQHL